MFVLPKKITKQKKMFSFIIIIIYLFKLRNVNDNNNNNGNDDNNFAMGNHMERDLLSSCH